MTCPCGEVFESPIYEYVNVAESPQLRYLVLSGSLNVATCPICGRRAANSQPFVYSDVPHGLLAYVHPDDDVPDEARQLILEQLRETYLRIVEAETPEREAEIPPLRIIFGLDQLNELINANLDQDERLGRLALSTRSRDRAERSQMLVLASRLAREMQCLVEEEDLPDEYTVWIYGSRRQIGALMRALAPRDK